MHPEVERFIAREASLLPYSPARVLEIGSQDVNGTLRHLFPLTDVYIGADVTDGPGVDLVCAGQDLTLDLFGEPFDVVICTNVLEHVDDATALGILTAAHGLLRPGGYLLLQCAGDGFTPHSGRSASLVLEADEFYRNVMEDDLLTWLGAAGYASGIVQLSDVWPFDLTCTALKQ